MLYVETNKDLYGLLQNALIFYRKLRKDLEAYVFVINTYYQCVSNTTVDGHQMTAIWHVDDLKVSHKEPYHITNFAIYLSSIYGDKLTVKCGRVYDYLGIDLHYSEEVSVKVYIIKYTGNILR